MLDALKFVKGAVSKRDFMPVLTHFQICNGRVKGYNGVVCLCSPLELDIQATPRADTFVKAIAQCKQAIALHMTSGGKLGIHSGTFTAFIECSTDPFPEVEPEGEVVQLSGFPILPAFKELLPFISRDTAKPWANGLLIDGQSAFATDNTILAEYWLGVIFPRTVNIPRVAIAEMLRLNIEPVAMQLNTNSVTFHYEDGKWLRTALLTVRWPDVHTMLERQANVLPIPEHFFEAVAAVEPFADNGRVVLESGGVRTTIDRGENGAYMEVPGLLVNAQAAFNPKLLLKLDGVATAFDFNSYPAPTMFYGQGIRGMIAGVRL